LVGISISLPPEVLAALDKMKDSKDRSPYLAELIAQEAKRNKVVIQTPKVTTASDTVIQAAVAFEKANGRAPAILELQQATKLSYAKVWNAVRSLGIKTLDRAQYEQIKRKETERVKQEELERITLPRLTKWLEQKTVYGLSYVKGSNQNWVEIGKLKVKLSQRYDNMQEALPEFTKIVEEIVHKHLYATFQEHEGKANTLEDHILDETRKKTNTKR